MSTPEYNSFNSPPRSPQTIKREGGSSPGSPQKYGRRLLIKELLSEDQVVTEGAILPQISSVSTVSPMNSSETVNSASFISNSATLELNIDHYNNSFAATTPPAISNLPEQQSVGSVSPTNSEFQSRQSQSPPASMSYVYSPTASSPGAFEDTSNESMNTLSVAERRERNKVASAKYRAKKHKQTQEMCGKIQTLNSRITGLVAENGLLERQLLELKDENSQLKTKIDELKMQLVEDNILKRLGKPRSVKSTIKMNSNVSSRRERTRHGNSGNAKGTMASQVNGSKSP